MEESVDSHSHMVTDTEYSTKRISTRTKVGYFTKEFESMSFLLKRISIICSTINFNLFSLNFNRLTLSHRLNKDTIYRNTSTSCDWFKILFTKFSNISYNLNIIDRRTIIKSYKANIFITTASTHPTLNVHFCTIISTFKCINNNCSLNFFHNYLYLLMQQKSTDQ